MSNTEDKPIQVIRSDSVAISYETRKGLRYVSRALGMPNVDALADQILTDWLHEKHPSITAHIDDCSIIEGKFERELKAKINPSPF